jgi:FKBP-type peptidyl-prolyl cis-trans isomerase
MSATPTFASPARRARRLLAPALAIVLVLGACANDDELGGEVVQDGLGCTVTSVDRRTEAPTVEPVAEVPDTTRIDDLEPADEAACTATSGTYLTVDMVGATASDATVFTDTFADDRPLTLRLGAGQLIVGLETALGSMSVGARRQITVPAVEAYGADGNEAQGIGPDEALVFVVDLVAVTDAPQWCNPLRDVPEGVRDGKPTEIAVPEAPPTEVVTTVLAEGDGPEATAESYLTVEYVGVSCATGQQFDSSWDREEPLTIAMADAELTATALSVIEGWTEGLLGQAQGSLVQIDIPAAKAYGSAGQGPIGPADPLTFVVQILEVADEAPADPAADAGAEGEAPQGEAPQADAPQTDEPTTEAE